MFPGDLVYGQVLDWQIEHSRSQQRQAQCPSDDAAPYPLAWPASQMADDEAQGKGLHCEEPPGELYKWEERYRVPERTG